MINQCIATSKRILYFYLEKENIEVTKGLRSSKPLLTLTISSDSEIYIKEIDDAERKT